MASASRTVLSLCAITTIVFPLSARFFNVCFTYFSDTESRDDVASSNINSAAAAAEEARINYEKYKMLYNKRLVTETDYLRAKTNYDSARAQLNASKNSLSSAQAELDSANDTNRKSVIKTNINGVIANMKLELHQQAALGSALFTVVNESEMVLEVGVSPQIVG